MAPATAIIRVQRMPTLSKRYGCGRAKLPSCWREYQRARDVVNRPNPWHGNLNSLTTKFSGPPHFAKGHKVIAIGGSTATRVRLVLRRKHFNKSCQYFYLSLGVQTTNLFYQLSFINCPYLVKYYLALSTLEFAVYSRWISPTFGGHRGNDNCIYVMVHLIWRDHHTWPSLFDLTSNRRIQVDKIYIESIDHHCHSFWSQSSWPVRSASSNLSSAFLDMFSNASSHPFLG